MGWLSKMQTSALAVLPCAPPPAMAKLPKSRNRGGGMTFQSAQRRSLQSTLCRLLTFVCLARSTLTIGTSRARADREPVFDADGAGAATAPRPDIDRGAVERRSGLRRRQRAPAPESGTSQQGAVTVVEDGLETGQFEWSERLPATRATRAVGKFPAEPCTAAGHSLSGQSAARRLDRPGCKGPGRPPDAIWERPGIERGRRLNAGS